MPKKIYVLDTSVLLAYGKQALSAFGEHEVVLPVIVVKELEKRRQDPLVGWIARRILKELDELHIKDSVVINDSKGTLRVEINHIDQSGLPDALRDGMHDVRILAVAANLQKEHEKNGTIVTLVSNDVPMRILATTVLDLEAEPFKTGYKPQGDISGLARVEVSPEIIEELFENKSVSYYDLDLPAETPANTGVIITAGTSSALAFRAKDRVRVLDYPKTAIQGKNSEQKIALQHLLNDKIPVVSLGGPAGTGKTLLALAAAIHKVREDKDSTYKKVMVFRPLQAVGNQNLGYLPGTEEEKMAPWAAAVYDAVEAFHSREEITSLVNRGQFEVLPVTHIRGRTFHDAYVIIDEAQNLERATLLTVLSRLGPGSKAVFSWDVSQRDNLSMGNHDGIVPIVDYFKNEPEFAHVALRKTERSRVAEMATKALEDLDI